MSNKYNNEAFNYDEKFKNAVNNITSLNFHNIVIHKNSSFARDFLPRCTIGLNLINLPTFIFEIVEDNIISLDENTGFIKAYKWKKGSKGGFANRKITLPIRGGKVFSKLGISKVDFCGDIWDDYSAYEFAYKYYGIDEIVQIGYRQQFDKLQIYTGASIDKRIIDIKMEIIGIRAI